MLNTFEAVPLAEVEKILSDKPELVDALRVMACDVNLLKEPDFVDAVLEAIEVRESAENG